MNSWTRSRSGSVDAVKTAVGLYSAEAVPDCDGTVFEPRGDEKAMAGFEQCAWLEKEEENSCGGSLLDRKLVGKVLNGQFAQFSWNKAEL